MPIAQLPHVDLYYTSYGEGPPLILIAGLCSNHRIWSLMVPELAKHFRVYIFDNRGVGQTTTTQDNYTVADMAEDVAQLLQCCHIDSAFIIGHSMGGAVLQKLCINHPEKVQAAIIAGSFAMLPKPAAMHIESIINFIHAGVSQDLILETVFPWIYGDSFVQIPAHITVELDRINNDPTPQTYEGYVGQVHALIAHNTLAQLGNIRCKTLVLAGDEDVLIPLKYAQILATHIPNAQLKTIAECGHMFHREQPGKFIDHIVSFFL